MAKIEIETLTDDCYKDCDAFYVESETMKAGPRTIGHYVRCAYVNRCRTIAKHIKDIEQGGDTHDD